MNREECENQIIEKLKEIKDIVKQYDTSEPFYLSLTMLGDDYMYINNRYYEDIETPINVSMIKGGVNSHDN